MVNARPSSSRRLRAASHSAWDDFGTCQCGCAHNEFYLSFMYRDCDLGTAPISAPLFARSFVVTTAANPPPAALFAITNAMVPMHTGHTVLLLSLLNHVCSSATSALFPCLLAGFP